MNGMRMNALVAPTSRMISISVRRLPMATASVLRISRVEAASRTIEPMNSTRPARSERFWTSRITSPAKVTVRTPGRPLNWSPNSSTTSGSGSIGTTR